MNNFKSKIDHCYRALLIGILSLSVILPLYWFSEFTFAGDFISIEKSFAFESVIFLGGMLTLAYVTLRKFDSPINVLNIGSVTIIMMMWYSYVLLNAVRNGVHLQDRSILELSFCILLYFTTLYAFNNEHSRLTREIFIYILLLSASIEAIIGLLQLYWLLPSLNKYFRITGTFKNPAPFSLYLAAVLPIALSAYINPTGLNLKSANVGLKRAISLITIILIGVILPVAGIRSSWIAALTGMSIVFWFKYRSGLIMLGNRILNSRLKKVIGLFALLLMSYLIISSLYLLKPKSADGRVLIWKVAIQQFEKHPFWGIGYTNYERNYNLWQANYFMKDSGLVTEKLPFANEEAGYLAGNVNKAYDEYLEMAVESGIAGLGLYFAFIILTLVSAARSINKEPTSISIGIFCSTIAVLVSGLFSYPFHSLPTFILLFILFAALQSARETNKNCFLTPKVGINLFRWKRFSNLCCFVVSLTVIVFCITSLQTIRAYADWKTAKLLYLQDRMEEAEEYYRSLYEELKTDGLFLIDYGLCLTKTKNYKEAVLVLREARSLTSDARVFIYSGQAFQGLADTKDAASEYKLAHFIFPHKLYPLYLLAKLYESDKDTTTAVHYATEVLKNKEKVESDVSAQIVQEMDELLNHLTKSSNGK